MRSADSAAAERSWVAMTTVRLSCFHSSRTSSSQTWLRGSRALVGSSSRRTCGCMVSTEAMATRFFSPPLSVYGGRSSTCSPASSSHDQVLKSGFEPHQHAFPDHLRRQHVAGAGQPVACLLYTSDAADD